MYLVDDIDELGSGGGLVYVLADFGGSGHAFDVPGKMLAHFADGH